MSAAKRRTPSRLADRLAGKRLLVTGATGFLGKVFVEKLLRCVPDVGTLSLLVRDRSDGLSGRDRLEAEILTSSVFERLTALLGPRFEGRCRDKLRVVSGDITDDQLGLSDYEYAALTKEVDIVVNCAAAVTFDERLDVALHLNTQGPGRLLKLARDCGNVPFMQVSTCYVSGRRVGEIREELSGPSHGDAIDLDDVVCQMERLCERIQGEPNLSGEALRRKLVESGMEFAHEFGWNDTYTFTKWLGEHLIARDRGDVPLVILRPAIIESSYEEPVPGWIDGLRMADPMIMAFGRGKLGEFPAVPDIPIDLIPVDHVANAMIAALPAPGEPPGIRIYQVASSHVNPLLISELARCMGEGFRLRPMSDDAGRAVEAGEFKLVDRQTFLRKWEKKQSRLAKYGSFLEALRLAPERRRKISAIISQIEQIIYFARIYAPYTHLNCRFMQDNVRRLAKSLHAQDRKEFPFAPEDIDWPDYIINKHLPGLRKFVLGGLKGSDRPALRPLEPQPDPDLIRESRAQARTIFDLFRRVACFCGDKTALQMCRGGRWISYTYTDALAATGTIARHFGDFDLAAGDRVVVCGENCPEWGLTYLAAMRAGLTAVPLDPQLPAEEIFACARFAGAKLIFAGSTNFESLSSAAPNAPGKGGKPFPVVPMTAPYVPAPGAARDPGPPPASANGDGIASILFTSGTTVAPKAVPLTHANLLSNARALLEVHRLQPDERFISVLPMYHAFEFTGGFVLPIALGGTITYVEQLKGPELMAAMQTAQPTIMLTVPRLLNLFHDGILRKVREASLLTRAMFRMLRFAAKFSGRQGARKLFGTVHRSFGGSLRMFISGGSALDPELYSSLTRMGFEVYEGYGLTETAPVLTVNPPGRSKSGSTGPALPGTELEIRNANNEGIGELWARGAGVMQGYLNNPQATAEVMRDGWLRTGDLCRRDADGYYYVTGRVKDMIVTDAGKNVYPDEVEARYKNMADVKEMCVLGMRNPGGIGESVHAIIVPDYASHPELDRSAMERSIREQTAALGADVPEHQRIQSLHFWSNELPKTSTLKAKRSVIRDMLMDHKGAGAAQAKPAPSAKTASRAAKDDGLTRSQRAVRKLLAELTREPEKTIRPESNLLLDLGVDSLMKLQLVGELEAHFELDCSNETASALARVSDVFALVADRPPRRGRKLAAESWHQRQPDVAAEQADQSDARLSLPLRPVRWFARGGTALLFRSYVRVRARGLQHIPREGPFIITPNHTSHLDAVAVLTAVAGRRRIWVAGAEDYFFDTPLKSWACGRLFDIIPFDRHTEGFEGLRRCLEKLEQGDGLLFFPEGTRSLTGALGEFKIGAALMAVQADAPLVPARIEHAFELLPKGRKIVHPGVVKVTFGEPVYPQPWSNPKDVNKQYQGFRELSRHMQECVAQLGNGPSLQAEDP